MNALSITKKTAMGVAVLAMTLGLGCSKKDGGGAVLSPGCGVNPGTCTVGSNYIGHGTLLSSVNGQGYISNNGYGNSYGNSSAQLNLAFYAVTEANIQNLESYRQQMANSGNNSNIGMPIYNGEAKASGKITIGTGNTTIPTTTVCQLDNGDYNVTVLQNGTWNSGYSNNGGWQSYGNSMTADINNLKIRATHATTAKFMDITLENGRVDGSSIYSNGSVNNNVRSVTGRAIIESINGQDCGRLVLNIDGSSNGSCDSRLYDCGYNNGGNIFDAFSPFR